MVRAGLSVRTFGRGGRPGFRPGLSVGEPSAPPWFRPGSAGLSAQTPRSTTGVCGPNPRSTTGVSSRNFGAARPRRPPDERSCGRDGPVTYRSSPERVCPRAVVPKGRAYRDRNGQTTPHARAPAGGRRDAGWPGVSAAPLRARCGRSAAILYYPLPSGVRRVRDSAGEKSVKRGCIKQTTKEHARTHTHTHPPH